MIPRLKELYYKEIQTALKEKLGFKNTFMGPKLDKVVINTLGNGSETRGSSRTTKSPSSIKRTILSFKMIV